MSLNKKMGDAHEERMVEALGGRPTRGSGNQAHDPMDGKHTRLEVRFGFAWDGKSTRGKSIGVTREMWDKAVEQAQDRRPMLGLCFYDDDRLRNYTDLIVVTMDDFQEVLQAAESSITSYEGWLEMGKTLGYCSEEFCDQHGGMMLTEEETEAFEAGEDPCVFVVRLYP